MQRVTITLDDELAAEVDRLVGERGYPSRSEAIRDLTRAGLHRAAEDRGEGGACVGALVYLYDHESRDLSQRIAGILHDHHDLVMSSLRFPLDHDSSMEVTVLRGDADLVGRMSDRIIGERGVNYGRLVTAPVVIQSEVHSHGGSAHRHVHTHVRTGG